MADYQIATTTVSKAEMNYAPFQTVKIIFELHGFVWASRLWQQWNLTLPKSGPHDDVWSESCKIRKWLDERKPIEAGRDA